ncbi:MAG: NAD+ synthase [Legionellaceae bacterium]|nr:NAD+ synthase [Legionellaceae bacterium]
MPPSLTLLMAQINPMVGAVALNSDKIINIITTHQHNHDVIIFPELSLTGYPLEDVLFRDQLYTKIETSLKAIAACTASCYVIVGHPSRDQDVLHNTASLFFNGQRVAQYHKQHLPNYGVFDEKRYFTPGDSSPCLLTIKGYRIGLCICEDLWHPGPADQIIDSKAHVLISMNASPFDVNKHEQRLALAKQYAQRGVAIVYVNLVGGQDELVFDGQSFALDNQGRLCARASVFSEHLQTITMRDHTMTSNITPLLEQSALVYQALVCGLRDYVNKNHFPGVLLGLSGGVDSALTLAIAVDALGPSRVLAVVMPSRYTADISNQDALAQLKALNVDHLTLPIEPAFNTILTTLEPAFAGRPQDTTEENIQARIRGILLMALSNKTGNMLLTTSNKSESAVGYATLYGDMCGGFAVLKDVLKTTVYLLAHYRNGLSPIIPERVLTRAPSAELAPNQTDQDNLPEYAVLDAIIQCYMDDGLDADAIITLGYPKDVVLRVITLIIRNEYKRRQAPPGTKITPCSFGRDWRYPMTNGL